MAMQQRIMHTYVAIYMPELAEEWMEENKSEEQGRHTDDSRSQE